VSQRSCRWLCHLLYGRCPYLCHHPSAATLRRSPAIVGVSKRLWRVCWGSQQLWRHLDLRGDEVEPPIATGAAANPPLNLEAWQERLQQWQSGYRAAKRAQLQRIDGWAESVAYSYYLMAKVLPVGAMLAMLSPEALAKLALYIPELRAKQAQQLAGFTRLTSLAIHAMFGCSDTATALRQLPRLQQLYLRANEMDAQLIAALPALTGLTRLVSCLCVLCSALSGSCLCVQQCGPRHAAHQLHVGCAACLPQRGRLLLSDCAGLESRPAAQPIGPQQLAAHAPLVGGCFGAQLASQQSHCAASSRQFRVGLLLLLGIQFWRLAGGRWQLWGCVYAASVMLA